MMVVAHGNSSLGDSGRHLKTLRRPSVSDTPVTVYGPVIVKSWRCGTCRSCGAPIASASVYSIGATRSSTRPENFGMNAADTRCGPAFTKIRLVRKLRPPFVSDIFGLMSSIAALSPLMETSTCSFVLRLPINPPFVAAWNLTAKTYSPSAGKLWTTETPPRVPIGAPSTCRNWLVVLGRLYVADVG